MVTESLETYVGAPSSCTEELVPRAGDLGVVAETHDNIVGSSCKSTEPGNIQALGVDGPSDPVHCRQVVLHVDSDKGAGLDLEANAYGYYVHEVDEYPGQDLKPGDIILDIEGIPLWGGLEEDVLGDRFGSQFKDKAQCRVAKLDEVNGRAMWQPLGLKAGELATRDPQLRESLQTDLRIMGERCGVTVDLLETDCAVALFGRPRALRLAVDELSRMAAFYFPELETIPGSSACQWWGAMDSRCDASGVQELSIWESALRKQWSEDDDIHDEDLPVEPLEAPDDGPDIFEGQVMCPACEISRPLRVIILMGLPGAGKSTLAERFRGMSWCVINQDTLGDRRACVAAARSALGARQYIVIDRCNISRLQRRVWLDIADEFEASVGCIWLDTDVEECGARVLRRFGHKTLPAEVSSLDVIQAFGERLEDAMEAEGFVLWRVRHEHEVDGAVEELLELVQWCEEEFAADMWVNMDTWGQQANTSMHSNVASKPKSSRKAKGSSSRAKGATQSKGNFGYDNVRQRGQRAIHLRAVRRQIEYYFSDANLKQDWFFQEKISEEPEEGWLEICWILSCPRIRDVYKATAEEVLASLGPSSLIVKSARGTNYVRRGRPLPQLTEPRPQHGAEPTWYKQLHSESKSCEASVESTTKSSKTDHLMCASCGQDKLQEAFSKAQRTRHRKNPVCKDCIGDKT